MFDLASEMLDDSNSVFLPTSQNCGQMQGLTHTRLMKVRYKWILKNFSSYGDYPVDRLVSPSFTLREEPSVEWELLMHPDTQPGGFLALYLTLKAVPPYPLKTKFRFTLPSRNGTDFSKAVKAQFETPTSLGCPEFITRKALFHEDASYLSGDVLTVLCDVSVLSAPISLSSFPFYVEEESAEDIARAQCHHDIEGLLNSAHLADATLVVENRDIPVHKAILAARSPVFKDMFTSKKLESRITVPDISYEVFQRLLAFLYTGTAPDTPQFARELLLAARRFGVPNLQCLAEKLTKQAVNKDNAVDMLLWADQHGEQELKKFVLNFILTMNLPEIMKLVEGNLTQDHPQLMMELLSHFLKFL